MYSAYTGVVHTKSDYINPTVPILRMKETSENKINFLKAQEQKVYKKIGANSYEDFIKVVRELFNEQDRIVLQRFEANNLEKELKKFASVNSELFDEEVKFIFNFNNMDNKIVKIKGKEIVLSDYLKLKINPESQLESFTYNSQNVKKQLNNYFKGSQKGGDKFNPDAGWTKNLDNFLTILLNSQVLQINKKKNSQDSSFSEVVKIHEIPNFPWGAMKKDVENAYSLQNQALIQELQAALVRMKKFIFFDLGAGASKELRLAMNRLWTKTFSPKENNPLLFFHGSTKSNFMSGVQGALGEFQAGLLFEYLNIKFQGVTKTSIAKIIGSDYLDNEKLRTDVEIFEGIGLQVKNLVTINGGEGFENLLPDRKISTTIHPYKFGKYLINQQPFYDIISNYYFNETFQKKKENQTIYDDLVAQLQECLGEIMNLSLSETVEDTISFYVIGGKFLIPGSVILKKANELDLKKSVKITSGFAIHPDEYYSDSSEKKRKSSPEFTDYWKRSRNGWKGWLPTKRNKTTYENLIKRMISIRTSFRLFKDIDDYKIF